MNIYAVLAQNKRGVLKRFIVAGDSPESAEKELSTRHRLYGFEFRCIIITSGLDLKDFVYALKSVFGDYAIKDADNPEPASKTPVLSIENSIVSNSTIVVETAKQPEFTQLESGISPPMTPKKPEKKKRRKPHWSKTDEGKAWSKLVRERDNWECRDCGGNFRLEKRNLHAHHILPQMRFPHLREDVDNGLSLCTKCHSKVHPALNHIFKHETK